MRLGLVDGDPMARGDALTALGMMDEDEHPAFGAVAELAATACDTAMGYITLVGDRQLFFIDRHGLTIRSGESPFSDVALETPDEALVVPDARADPRFAGNPIVASGQVRYYAGIPLVTDEGVTLGTLCVLDAEPREIKRDQLTTLTQLAQVTVDLLQARRAARSLRMTVAELNTVRADHVVAQEHFGVVFDGAPLGMVIVGNDGVCLRANEAFAQLIGTTTDALVNTSALGWTLPDDVPAERERLLDLREGRATVILREKRYLHANGTAVPAVVSTSMIRRPPGDSDAASFVTLSTIESVAERRAAETRMLEVQSAVDGIISLDARGRITNWNLGAERMFGFRAAEVMGATLEVFVPRGLCDGRSQGLLYGEGSPTGLVGATVDLPARRADGQILQIELTISSWVQHDQVNYTGIVRDVTNRKLAEQRVDLLAHAARTANDAETFDSAAAIILGEVCARLGWTAGVAWTANENPAVWWVAPHEHPTAARQDCALHQLRRDGTRPSKRFVLTDGQTRQGDSDDLLASRMGDIVVTCAVDSYVAVPVVGPRQVAGGIAFCLPAGVRAPSHELLACLEQIGVLLGRVTDREAAATLLTAQAQRDYLTGLANRRQLMVEVSAVLQGMATGELSGGSGLLLIDLDRFKIINESLGHGAGDVVLQEVARRLAEAAPAGDIVGRLGGDEFVVLLRDTYTGPRSGASGVNPIADRAQYFLDAICRPVQVAGHTVIIRACIGALEIGPEHATTGGLPAIVLRDADTALMHAKKHGKNRVQMFTGDMRQRMASRLDDEYALGAAIAAGEMRLHYQPVINLRTGQPVGAEALVRWPRPGHGLVAPDQFIPLAEESGLIVELGRWVLNQACLDAAGWHLTVPRLGSAPVNVNVSARQLSHPRFSDYVDEALFRSGLPANRLVLEITESVLIDDDSIGATLGELRARGIRIALDDFGTGYSSLNYVQRLEVDIIKIDKSFVDLITGPGQGTALTEVVLKLADAMGLATTAEGVETPAQARALDALGCLSGQGWTWARAVPLDELAKALPEPAQA